MRKLTVFLLLISCIGTLSFAQNADEIEIRNILSKQTKEWNDGNIPGFMETYWKSDSLMFVGKNGVTYGWQKTMDNYKKNYPDAVAMGKLQFELIDVRPLSAVYFFVIGKWHLTRSIGDIGGAFTLLIKKINNKWVIVADHSS